MMMEKRFYVRTHGGLGNQLFQVFFLMLKAKNEKIYYFHDDNYAHGFKWELPKAMRFVEAKGWERLLLQVKLPKLLKKTNISSSGSVRVGNYHFYDGYFQDRSFYESFSECDIQAVLRYLNDWCEIDQSKRVDKSLYHLRLGDFFESEDEEIAYAEKKLNEIPCKSCVISNRDDIFCRKNLEDFYKTRDIKYYFTANKSPLSLLRFMSAFESIETNGSTLAFWAGLLTGKKIVLNNSRLDALYKYLIC